MYKAEREGEGRRGGREGGRKREESSKERGERQMGGY
jgi:hypothetical protein